MNHKPVCVKCNREMKPERNGVGCLDMTDFSPYAVWDSDLWKCPTCGYEILVGFGKDAIAWAKECQELGAGVILPTSMDGDGTQAGYDLEFTRAISDVVDLPVVASGGAGKLEHFYEAVVQGGAQILLAASVFHFRIHSIREVKEYLRGKGLQVNL